MTLELARSLLGLEEMRGPRPNPPHRASRELQGTKQSKPPGHEAHQVQVRRGSVWIPQVPDPHGASSADANHHHAKLPLGLKHKGSGWGLKTAQASSKAQRNKDVWAGPVRVQTSKEANPEHTGSCSS